MIISFADWQFDVDVEATRIHTNKNATDHCECDYCKNYYESISLVCPELCSFLSQFGINILGPSELMPFEPTLILACYRICGTISRWGESQIFCGIIPIIPEAVDADTFLLWVGEISLPWIQEIDIDNVVSPANFPEFLMRMEDIWLLRHGTERFFPEYVNHTVE